MNADMSGAGLSPSVAAGPWDRSQDWRERFARMPVRAVVPNLPLRVRGREAPWATTLSIDVRHRGAAEAVCVLPVRLDVEGVWELAPRWREAVAVLPLHVVSREGDPQESCAVIEAICIAPRLPVPFAPCNSGHAQPIAPWLASSPQTRQAMPPSAVNPLPGFELLVLVLVAWTPPAAIDAVPVADSFPTGALASDAATPVPAASEAGGLASDKAWRKIECALQECLDGDRRGRLKTHWIVDPWRRGGAAPGSASATRPPRDDVTFYLASCLYPAGLAEASRRPSPNESDANWHGPGDLALWRLRRAKADLDNDGDVPLILAGDQVYVDATAGVFDPGTLDAPRLAAYRARALNPLVQRLAAERVIPITLMDDHEVCNDWEPGLDERRTRESRDRLRDSRDDFVREQRRGVAVSSDASAPPWRTWRVDAAAAFGADFGEHLLIVGDTRSERAARNPCDPLTPSILGGDARTAPRQWLAWKAALREHANARSQAWRIVATSAMVLPRPVEVAQEADFDAAADAAALCCDGWSGYPGSLRRLLAFLCDGAADATADTDEADARSPITNCLFVSGDAHVGCIAVADVEPVDAAGRPTGRSVRLWSVHTPALYAPYPFANGRAEDFAERDDFAFDHPDDAEPSVVQARRRYRCRVQAWFPPPGDGFVRIVLPPHADGTKPPHVEFHRADGKLPSIWPPSTPAASPFASSSGTPSESVPSASSSSATALSSPPSTPTGLRPSSSGLFAAVLVLAALAALRFSGARRHR